MWEAGLQGANRQLQVPSSNQMGIKRAEASMRDASWRLEQTCLGSNADGRHCAQVDNLKLQLQGSTCRLSEDLDNFISPTSRCDRFTFEDLPILKTAGIGVFEWPLFPSHRSFPLLRLGRGERSSPHIASLRTTQKILLIGPLVHCLGSCGCLATIGVSRVCMSGAQMSSRRLCGPVQLRSD